jgi:ABC-type lipoprotein release transport system permease subunit
MWRNLEWEVVGIVRDVHHLSPELDPGIQVYFSLLQMADFSTLDLVVRSRLPTDQVVAAVSPVLHEVDPGMPTQEFWTLQNSVERAVSARSFTLWILTVYGGAALLLAALGIYGVLAQSVAERTQEIGIRIALGASWNEVVRNVLGRTLLLTGLGITAGGLVSVWASTLLGTLLFGVGARDPLTFVGMALVILSVAVLAGLVPALRAGRIRGTRALQAL